MQVDTFVPNDIAVRWFQRVCMYAKVCELLKPLRIATMMLDPIDIDIILRALVPVICRIRRYVHMHA